MNLASNIHIYFMFYLHNIQSQRNKTVLVLNITPVVMINIKTQCSIDKNVYCACLAVRIQIMAFVFTNTTHT